MQRSEPVSQTKEYNAPSQIPLGPLQVAEWPLLLLLPPPLLELQEAPSDRGLAWGPDDVEHSAPWLLLAKVAEAEAEAEALALPSLHGLWWGLA